jgi:putative ABC transport system ATP-binding protein
VVFADEPTASLDHSAGEAVIRLLNERREGALVVVTHDPSMLEAADRILRMEDGAIVER